MSALRPPRARSWELDEACAAAVDLARSAAGEMAGPAQVGEYLEARAEGDRVVTHLFRCADPAYAGWHWAVTVARAARAKTVTVSESVLLPGPEALLAPEWVPWRERVRPGDIGVGDLMPAEPDDERLVPAAVLTGDDGLLDWDDSEPWRTWSSRDAWLADETAQADEDATESPPELPAARWDDDSTAVGRARVLSAIGRDDTALRWYSGENGPHSPLAHAAPGPCMTCGFLIRLGDPLGRVFGVCANEYAPDDGRVVSLDHGCGAHSEATSAAGAREAASPVIDEVGYDIVDRPGASVDETVFESLDHA